VADGSGKPLIAASPRVVWSPLQGSQELAMSCPCNHILYEGTRGPGKTDAQLMKFRRYVGLGYGAFWRGIIFDRQYKHLDDLIAKSKRWFPGFFDGAKFVSGTGQLKWTWPTGEELLFRVVKELKDYWDYHGQEFPFIGWNELTKYPSSELYEVMMSLNRTSFRPEDHPWHDGSLLPQIPLIVMATTNPFGAGHHWVKSKFIDVAPPGVPIELRTNVFNPQTQRREDIVKTQVRIFGSYKENRYLPPEYIAELERMSNDNRRRAWLHGDWNINAGGMFDDLWDNDIHIVPRFKIPRGWALDRSHDWGSSAPFDVQWWAEANGEEAMMPDGSTWAPPRGTLICFHEWYGTRELGTNKGLMLTAKKVAEGVKQEEAKLREKRWIAEAVLPGPADNSIGTVVNRDADSIADIMSDNGVDWEKSDKSAGSRKNGVQLFRDRLEAAIEREGPAVYYMAHCTGAITTIPALPRDDKDPDDVDTTAEDHPWDTTRYRILKAGNRAARPESVIITRPR
jgi:hypothetical protein